MSIIYERKLIAKRYIRSRFTIDLLSAIPIDLIAGTFFNKDDAKQLKAFSLLKLIRMLRLSRIIRAMNVVRDIKTKVKLGQVFFVLLLYLHCQACVIWFIIQNDKLWENPVLILDQNWNVRFYADAMSAQYSVSMYLSLLSLLGVDIMPLTILGFGT